MINYYFGSKDKLFQAMIEEKASYMRLKIEELNNNKSLSDIEKIDIVIESYVHRFFAHPNFHRVLQQELLVKQREEMHQNIVNILTKNILNIVSIIENGIAKKVFRDVDAQLTYASIIGCINQVMANTLLCNVLMNKPIDHDPYSDNAFKDRLVKHLKQMIHALLLVNP
jgi:AcrR family transcriptional regulator